MKENKKKISSIFENRHETPSQEIFLRSCGFAQRGVPPNSERDGLIGSGYDENLVENHAIRLVSPPHSDEDPADRTVPVTVESEGNSIGNLLLSGSDIPSTSSRNRRDERSAKKLKIPLRDVVKAIVMNSKNIEEEEDKEIEKMSFVQILMNKGFKFP